MFTGHYAVALAAKRLSPRLSLGWTFLAVQFLDLLWAPLVLLGVEHARLQPGHLPASPFVLFDMPWTHSLVMAVVYAWFVFRFTKKAVLGFCIFSHWVLDFLMHYQDLPIYRGAPYVGLGLWRSQILSVLVESAMLVIGLWVYLQATRPKTPVGRWSMIAYVGFLLAVTVVNIYGPPPPTLKVAVIFAEIAYLLFAGVAWWLDRFREPLAPEPETRLNLAEV